MTDSSVENKKINLGLISLGMCCQTKHQLRFQQPGLRDLGIEEGSLPSGYFDWLISSPESTAMFIRDGLPQFASGDIELQFQPYWKKYGIYFWHEFRKGEVVNIEEYFDCYQKKFDYLREVFHNLNRYKRLVFVLSNTQNNLIEVQQQTGSLDFMLNDAKIKQVSVSLKACLNREFELLVVTNKERFEGELSRDGGYHLEFFELDQSEWKGDKREWNSFLRRYFTKFPVLNREEG